MKIKKADELHTCHHCIGDPFLKSEIKINGECIKCAYCKRKANGYSLEKLANIEMTEKCDMLLLSRSNEVIVIKEVSSRGMTGTTVGDPKLVIQWL